MSGEQAICGACWQTLCTDALCCCCSSSPPLVLPPASAAGLAARTMPTPQRPPTSPPPLELPPQLQALLAPQPVQKRRPLVRMPHPAAWPSCIESVHQMIPWHAAMCTKNIGYGCKYRSASAPEHQLDWRLASLQAQVPLQQPDLRQPLPRQEVPGAPTQSRIANRLQHHLHVRTGIWHQLLNEICSEMRCFQ